ncbi:NADP-dependent oxidoreductase [Isoptericola sp. F-RaC21]|uniref:MDR family NADP-dependent oxidoreductase n=1 Tax=Isoptericola sp. F-RaC21 TaxID=3141452 RepID=UPI00315BE30B
MTDTREVRLRSVPQGLPGPEHFEVVRVPVPEPGPGEVLVRNRAFHVFAGLRTLLAGDVPDTPLPPIRPGDTLSGSAVGEVLAPPPGSGLARGALVTHWLGWREHAVVPVDQVAPLDDVLPPVAHLTQARTAYEALRQGRVAPGETVFVSGGAGSVGSMAGQMARLLGAGRVIGSTSSAEKAARMVAELGYDDVVLRDGTPPAAQLEQVAPDGIDVMVDNVGGEQLAAGLAAARTGARIVLVGALSGQLDPDALRNPTVALDSFRLVLRQITVQGLSHAQPSDWAARVGEWAARGQLAFPHVRIPGIDRAPAALADTMAGRYAGTVVVEV